MKIEQLEVARQKCWIDTYSAVAGVVGVSDKTIATRWADAGLADFDKRFKPQPLRFYDRRILCKKNI